MRLVLAVLVVIGLRSAHADQSDEPVTLRLGTLAVEGSRYMTDIAAFSAELEKRARISITWASSGQLGDEAAMVEQIESGKLDGAGFSETGLIAAVPEMAVWRYPGMFRDASEVDRATAARGARVREQFAKRGLVFAMWADLGFANVFASERAATLHEMLGRASPWITMPLDATLFEPVASGKARAWAMPPLYVLAIGKVQAKEMSRLPYRYVIGGLVLSRAAWARLDAKQQKVFREICRAWEPRLRTRWRAETERGVAALEKLGVRVRAVSERELETFFGAAAKSSAAHAEKAGLGDAFRELAAARAKR
ncbi:MAG TPA: TRAP transporter substrate-binding protein DctP [Kofleriaceae bacterium]